MSDPKPEYRVLIDGHPSLDPDIMMPGHSVTVTYMTPNGLRIDRKAICGYCKDCKRWIPFHDYMSGRCGNRDCPIKNVVIPPDFGCVQWESKFEARENEGNKD